MVVSELVRKLTQRRVKIDAAPDCSFESSPEPSVADAASPHASISFDACNRSEWLRSRKTPEEDRVGELLREWLQVRGPMPLHSPAWESGGSQSDNEMTKLLLQAISTHREEQHEHDGKQPCTLLHVGDDDSDDHLANDPDLLCSVDEPKSMHWISAPSLQLLNFDASGCVIHYDVGLRPVLRHAHKVLFACVSCTDEVKLFHCRASSVTHNRGSDVEAGTNDHVCIALAPHQKRWAIGVAGSLAECKLVAKLALALVFSWASPGGGPPAFEEFLKAVMRSWVAECEHRNSFFDFDELPDEIVDENAAQEASPLPTWLDKVEGTVNVGVVGNSGVGKSLLINAIRKVKPGFDGWAAVGVNETTVEPTKYIFPTEDRICLWDLPGAGTPSFPLDTYVTSMGLRYFDAVLLLTATRFTSTEVELARELEEHKVPFFMVRTKIDQDVENNSHDNNRTEAATLEEISDDLKRRGVSSPYLVSSREPDKYDLNRLVCELFPTLRKLLELDVNPDICKWAADEWALPEAHSPSLSGMQGLWQNKDATMQYLVHGSELHLTRLADGRSAELELVTNGGHVWITDLWRIDEADVASAQTTRELLVRATQSCVQDFVIRLCS